jgi:lipopolysaccharide transport system permease protein
VRYLLGIGLQLWLYATPIAYPSSLIPEKWHLLYNLNPMTLVIEGFRWALTGTETIRAEALLSLPLLLIVLVSGLYFFRRMERIFADVV